MTEAEINKFENELGKLINSFSQYFLGVERLPPFKQRDDLARIIRNNLAVNIKNTQLKFRYLNLVEKYKLYNSQWEKTLKKIEEGVYERDRFKLKIKENSQPEPSEEKNKEESKAPVKQTNDPAHLITKKFLEMKKGLNISTGENEYQKVHTMIMETAKKLKLQHPGKSVLFKIEVINNKPVLKAVLKEKKV